MKDQLVNKLLEIGGKGVKFGIDTEQEIKRMLNDGIVYDTIKKHIKGLNNQCHYNSAITHLKNTKNKIVSGYALINNIWYCHSWIYNNGIIETTTNNFELYFGYLLTEKETELFINENLN